MNERGMLSYQDGEFFILRANGDSMTGASINHGDLVVIRKQNTAEEGQIVMVLVDNKSTLKRLYLDEKRQYMRLHPENEKYPDIHAKECSIQGGRSM